MTMTLHGLGLTKVGVQLTAIDSFSFDSFYLHSSSTRLSNFDALQH